MSFKQFTTSIGGIINNKHVNTFSGIYRHLIWQVRKIFNFFPFEQTISKSRIIASHKRCGVSALINNQGMYDYNNMHFIKMLLRNGGIFFDIGANIGSYTLIASEQNKAKVFAFEPHPLTFQLLQKNLEINKYNNALAYNYALGSVNGMISFTDNSKSSINHIVNDNSDIKNTIKVNCIRVDSFCNEYNVQPNIIKIDVEGFEYDVLLSFGEYLPSVDVVFIEINGLSEKRSKGEIDILELLKANNLMGPYSFDYTTSYLIKASTSAIEDVVFISERFANKLNEIGVKLIR